MNRTALLVVAVAAASLTCGCSLLAFDDMSSENGKTSATRTGGGTRAEESDSADPDVLEPTSSEAAPGSGPGSSGATDAGADANEAGTLPAPKDSGPREEPPPLVSPCTTVENADDDAMTISAADVTVCGQISSAADLDAFQFGFGGGGGSGTVKVVRISGSGSPSIVFRRKSGDVSLALNQQGSVTAAGGEVAKLEIRAGSATTFPVRYYAIIEHQNN